MGLSWVYSIQLLWHVFILIISNSFVKTKNIKDIGLEVRVMVFNATFNNISVISWQSVLLVSLYLYKQTMSTGILLKSGHDRMVVGFTTSYVTSSSNPA
jgi:hypothetical protein